MTIAPTVNLQKSRADRDFDDFHVSSYRVLAKPSHTQQTRDLEYPNVVVVPATRNRGTLRNAVKVAGMAKCPLVIICSKTLTSKDALAELHSEGLPTGMLPPSVLAVELNDKHAMSALNLKTSRFHTVTDQRCDTSDKRNLAILAARRLGWERILFLDDDIAGLGRAELDTMARLMARRTKEDAKIEAVGWAFSRTSPEFTADNSVVCHAYRSTGAQQDSFIGAGGLMIRCDENVSFFPKIYNEDWLFLLPSLAAGRVLLAGELSQTAFDPFADPRRAEHEEFGDLLAEGLYTKLHEIHFSLQQDSPLETIWQHGKNAHWWKGVIDRRRRFIDLIQARLRALLPSRQPVFASLDAAKNALRNSWSDLLTDFVSAWQEDLDTWRDELQKLPNPAPVIESDRQTLEAVFRDLGLSEPLWLDSAAAGHPRARTEDFALAAS